jgi:hypothetical protein
VPLLFHNHNECEAMRPVAFSACLHKMFKIVASKSPDDMKAYRQGLAYRILQGVSLADLPPLSTKDETRAREEAEQAPVNCLMSMEDYLAEHCMPGVRNSRCIFFSTVLQVLKANDDPKLQPLRADWISRSGYADAGDAMQAPLFLENVTSTYWEVMQVCALVFKDFERQRQRWPGRDEMKWIVPEVKKIILNNASSHNAVGGTLLHLYLRAAEENIPVFSFTDNKLTHTEEFPLYALGKIGETKEVLDRVSLKTGETDLDQSLLSLDSILSHPDTPRDDHRNLTLHIWANMHYSPVRMGCPFLRLKQLPHFVSGIINKFVEPLVR